MRITLRNVADRSRGEVGAKAGSDFARGKELQGKELHRAKRAIQACEGRGTLSPWRSLLSSVRDTHRLLISGNDTRFSMYAITYTAP